SDTITNTSDNKGGDVNSLVSLLGINAAEVKSVPISTETNIVLKAINSIGDRLSEMERQTNPRTPSFSVRDNSLFQMPPGYFPLKDDDEISKGDFVWHPRYGEGIVQQITGTKESPNLVTVFKDSGAKVTLRRLPTLYLL